jgi:ATP-dependent DNA helicase RecG
MVVLKQAKPISTKEAAEIIATKEGHYDDVKAKDIEPAKLSKTISAFANASGGEVFLGIGETKRNGKKHRNWSGFADFEDANAHFQVLDGMSALGNHYRAGFLQCGGKRGYVLHLTVLKTTDILKATNGVAYVRKNAQNLPMDTTEKLQRLRLNKGIVSFEDETVNAPLQRIVGSEVAQHFLERVVPKSTPSEWFDSQFLVVDGKPTVAATLLNADVPQAALPKRSGVKIYRYMTRDREGTRETLVGQPYTVEGCLYNLIRDSVRKTKDLIEGISRLGVHGLESVSYPDETLHEIVTNAVLHRDYSLSSDIHIRIYDDRVEVESPGTLPGHVTVDNILGTQAHRNPKIVRLINKFPDPPNKDVGEGLNTAFEAMKRMRLREPEIEEKGHSVVVYIDHAPLASPETTVLAYLEKNSEITNMIARGLTGIRSETTMKNVFVRLHERGQLEPVPDKKGPASSWRKPTGAKKMRHRS